MELAHAYNRASAQILLRWIYQLGAITNPRSMSEAHMRENLDIFLKSFTISDGDMARITNLAQDTCKIDSDWYECVRKHNHFLFLVYQNFLAFSLSFKSKLSVINKSNDLSAYIFYVVLY